MILTELSQKYGKIITPKELATFLGIDQRTLKKYHHSWGGVEVAPGLFRFFKNRITEIIDAEFNKETRKNTLPWKYNGQWENKPKVVSKCVNTIKKRSNSVGKRTKGNNGKETVHDKFGIFDNC